jgi:hypothetical protein
LVSPWVASRSLATTYVPLCVAVHPHAEIEGGHEFGCGPAAASPVIRTSDATVETTTRITSVKDILAILNMFTPEFDWNLLFEFGN